MSKKTKDALLRIQQPKFKTTKINRIWKKIQKQKQKSANYRADVDKCMALYQQHIIPAQNKYLLPELLALSERLLEFFERKSLNNRQRDMTVRWISRIEEEINEINVELASELQYKMMNLMQKVAKYKLSDEQIQ